MLDSSFVILSILLGGAMAGWPSFPNDFAWSSAGPIAGYTCTLVNEPLDPHTWNDNYICWAARSDLIDAGIRWSYSGPIQGMRCSLIYESADPHAWNDNYLCVPVYSPYKFEWSSSGVMNGKSCLQWLESADPNTWDDNFLCSS